MAQQARNEQPLTWSTRLYAMTSFVSLPPTEALGYGFSVGIHWLSDRHSLFGFGLDAILPANNRYNPSGSLFVRMGGSLFWSKVVSLELVVGLGAGWLDLTAEEEGDISGGGVGFELDGQLSARFLPLETFNFLVSLRLRAPLYEIQRRRETDGGDSRKESFYVLPVTVELGFAF